VCNGQQCVTAACGPQNCKGCCFGDQCLTGTDPTACGAGGEQCLNCASIGEACIAGGGVGGSCQPPPTPCGPMTCPGCCSGMICQPGFANDACGLMGQVCQDCKPFGQGAICSNGVCVPPPPLCNSATCPGCCDVTGACQPGFVDGQCGQLGASCQNCTALVPPSTCDVNVMPRVCTSLQAQCPAPYSGCPAGLQNPVPAKQAACSMADLTNASSACKGGAHTAGCMSFFQFENSQNPVCAKCLSLFDVDFTELTGVFTCAAPFVDATCNHATACAADCGNQSCSMCPDPAAADQCRSSVATAQCQVYVQPAQCVGAALMGPALFCNPSQYSNVFGAWLEGVGQHYCLQ
jgi:hypothetical protein